MFKNKNEHKNRRLEDKRGEVHSVIAAGTMFRGNIEGPEGLQVSGKLKGSVKCKGLVIVDKGAKIEGPVEAPFLIIEGEIRGDITSAEHIELREDGGVTGNISTQRLAMAEGSFYRGEIQMTDAKAQPLIFTEKRNRDQTRTASQTPGSKKE